MSHESDSLITGLAVQTIACTVQSICRKKKTRNIVTMDSLASGLGHWAVIWLRRGRMWVSGDANVDAQGQNVGEQGC